MTKTMELALHKPRTSQIGLYGALFIAFIFFNCVFYREFSYLSIFNNLYITEIFIALSLFVCVAKVGVSPSTYKIKNTEIQLTLFVFIFWATTLLVIDNGSEILFKIREYASVYYSLFLFFTIALMGSRRKSMLVFRTILVAAFFSMLLVLYKFVFGLGNVTTTDLVYRYGNYEFVGIVILFSYILSGLLLRPDKSQTLGLAFVLLCLFVVNFLIAHRSASLGITLSAIIVLLAVGRSKKAFNKSVTFIVVTTFILSLLVYISPDFGGSAFSRISGIFDSSIYEDANASWRLFVWSHAISPLGISEIFFGVGWGYYINPLFFEGRDYAVDGFIGIHNSIVFYLLHVGVVGVSIFTYLIVLVYRRAIRALKIASTSLDKQVITGLLAGNCGILFFSLFNVVLEGPYMSVVFWTSLGLLYNFSGFAKIHGVQKQFKMS